MVKKFALKHDYQTRILTLSWAAPVYLPYSYKLLFNCYLLDSNTQYRKAQYSLPSTTVNFTFAGILENSKCKVNLLAEYNPASIDPGLDQLLLVTIPSKSKYINTCIEYNTLYLNSHKFLQ